MKLVLKSLVLILATAGIPSFAGAQSLPGNIQTTESGRELRPAPLDDITETTTINRRILAYDTPREADVFWKRRVWRVVDVREKVNQPFGYEKRPLIQVLLDAAMKGVEDPNSPLPPLRVFSDEDFKIEMDTAALNAKLYKMDTVPVTNPETFETTMQIVKNDLNPKDVQRFRIKEIYYFDKEASVMKVRILGIAPIKQIFTSTGEAIGDAPVFWIYYPEAREYLARERVFNEGNDASPLSWEDIFENRYFSSYIFKASNVKDKRLEDFFPNSRRDLLMEAEKIKNEIFNFEQDLWTY
ncbi:MAG: gliding motility protein GldN [Saprospiraceae bacterium]|jgi:gliding motility associated protien GldN